MTARLDDNHPAIDVGIVITDWNEARRFWIDTLGFEHTADTPFGLGAGGAMHRVRAGGTTLKLIQLDVAPAERQPDGPIHRAVGVRYLTFWVRNLEELQAHLAEAGYPIVIPIRTVRPGVRILMTVDPDGTTVELLQTDPE